MAATIANLVRITGQHDVWGGHAMESFLYTGPATYAPGVNGGDEVDAISFTKGSQTNLRTIGVIMPAVTVSGLYNIVPQPLSLSSRGWPASWVLRWIVISSGLEAAAVGLSGEQAIITIVGD